MQVDEAGTGGHAAALHHQIEGAERRTDRCHHGQHGDLGLEHRLLLQAQSNEAQITNGGALGEGQPEAARQTHGRLGEENAEQEVHGWQLQHREAELESRERVPFSKGRRQQSGNPEAPAPGQGRRRPHQGRAQEQPQGGEGPDEQWDQQGSTKPDHQQRGKIGEDGKSTEHIPAERCRYQPPGLDLQVGEATDQQDQQHGLNGHQWAWIEPEQGIGGQDFRARPLAEIPAALELLELEGDPKPHHHQKGGQLQQPPAQHHRFEAELAEPLPLDPQAWNSHPQQDGRRDQESRGLNQQRRSRRTQCHGLRLGSGRS